MSSGHAISVELPADLYERIRRVAARSDRSIETVLVESLNVLFGVPLIEVSSALESLENYSDEQLWAVVYQRLAWVENERLRELMARGKQRQLTPDEQTELAGLLDRVDRYTVLRSRALWLLKQRGHEVDRYLKLGA